MCSFNTSFSFAENFWSLSLVQIMEWANPGSLEYFWRSLSRSSINLKILASSKETLNGFVIYASAPDSIPS